MENIMTLIKYFDMFTMHEDIPYRVFEVELQDELFNCGFIDSKWDETLKKYNIEPDHQIENLFSEDAIAGANLELLAAMITYVFRGCTHWWECSLFKYNDFFIQSFTRLKELLEEAAK